MAAAVQRKRPNREIRTLVCCEICISRAGFCLVESNETSVFLAVSPIPNKAVVRNAPAVGPLDITVSMFCCTSVTVFFTVMFYFLPTTHPWFMSCSVSSSQTRTCMAFPSRIQWKMSSMAAPPPARPTTEICNKQLCHLSLLTTAVRTVFFLSDQNRCCSCGAIELQQSAAHILII